MSGPTATRAHVLIVDDDPRFLAAIGRLLKGEHQVSTEQVPTQVLARLATEGPFDLILCDLSMPDLTGPQLHRQLMEHAAPQGLRMVFFTGGAVSDEASAFLARPDVEHLSKYLSPASLKEEVTRHVQRLGRLPRL